MDEAAEAVDEPVVWVVSGVLAAVAVAVDSVCVAVPVALDAVLVPVVGELVAVVDASDSVLVSAPPLLLIVTPDPTCVVDEVAPELFVDSV